ncbi:peptidoglycan-binding domain-containing protein [Sinorhizobium meliloti]|uniref:peptidoglycan-binding domain-containing protein n=1 Tax=Rhizobium meliloti TaxID=382 RepID=UPI00041579E8|nr:peptidoglycan-binding protein [Sinorhizobium meliloti]
MFRMTEAALQLMWKRCNFPVPTEGMAFFGLRGCLPVDYNGTDFADSHEVNIHDVDYVHMRCTLGQWKPGHGFALFPASTVPEKNYVISRIRRGGYGANQLMLGCYSYRKGMHKAGKPTGHRAFRQNGFFPVWRTADDEDYDTSDFVDMRRDFIAWDNLHCGWSNGPSSPSFSSVGCQVVAGFPKCHSRGASSADEGPWKKFLDNAYGFRQQIFPYALFSGHEAQSVVVLGDGQLRQSLRFGSQGNVVEAMQDRLNALGFDAGDVDGKFGFDSLKALIAFQKKTIGEHGTDGIVGPMTAHALGMELPYVTGDSTALPRPMFDNDELEALRPPPDSERAIASTALQLTVLNETSGGRTRYFAEADGRKIFIGRKVSYGSNIGLTNIYDLNMMPAGAYDNFDAATDHGSWAHFIWPTAIGESKGYFACVNTYDRARFTIGFSQLAAHTPDENLIVLFRRLLALPDAGRYFPDLVLVNGKVHQKISSTETKNLEKVSDGELKRFMTYFNPDLSIVDNSEVIGAARLIFGMMESELHKNLQIGLTIEIAKTKTKRAVNKGVPIIGNKLRYAMWVFDILHQGRGSYGKLRTALQSSNPEQALMEFGWPTHEDRIKAVKAAMDKLQNDGTLKIDSLRYGEGDFG